MALIILYYLVFKLQRLVEANWRLANCTEAFWSTTAGKRQNSVKSKCWDNKRLKFRSWRELQRLLREKSKFGLTFLIHPVHLNLPCLRKKPLKNCTPLTLCKGLMDLLRAYMVTWGWEAEEGGVIPPQAKVFYPPKRQFVLILPFTP